MKFFLSTIVIFFLGVTLNAGDYQQYKNACDGGNARGCFNLGLMYYKGRGVKQDDFKAKELYGKACDGGCAGGCYNLGFM